MTADLGPIQTTLELNASQFDRALDSSSAKVDDFLAKTGQLSGTRIDVAPQGARELDQASRSATGLQKAADGASKAAAGINVPASTSKDLGAAASAAGGLTDELGRASAAAGSVNVPQGMPASLDAVASSAGGLVEAFDKAAAAADKLSLDNVERGQAQVGGLLGVVKELTPALSAAAAAGTVLTKGFGRLTSIDDAQFKLQGLGHTGESVTDIMNSAMDSVTGTAYGFGEAASLAAGVVAATGAQGEELTQILTTVADTSAIAGRSLGDIGLIFNQVAASGTLMGDDLNQLMDAGIPVLQMLSDELGIAASEVKGLASESEISFAQFEAAMRAGMGGAAQEMGQSVTGAISNVGAALGRLGAEILSGPFDTMPDMLTAAQGAVDGLTDAVKLAYGAWNELPSAVHTVVGALVAAKTASTILGDEWGGNMVDGIKGVASSLGDMGRGFGDTIRLTGMLAADTRAANPEMSRMGAILDTLGSGGGVAASGLSKAKGALGGIVGALGGPWNLAIGGATAAVALFINHIQKSRQEQEKAEQSTKDWAGVLADAGGEITDAVADQALLAVEQAELGDLLEKTGLSAADAAAGIIDLDGAYSDVIAQLDRVIAAGEKAPGVFTGRTWTEEARAAMELKDELEGLRGSYEAGIDGAAEVENAQSDLAQKIAESARESEKSVTSHDMMNSVLAQMGEDAKDADDAIGNLTAAMMGLSDDPSIRLQGYLGDSAAAIESLKDSITEGGFGGFDVETGFFDEWTEQGRALAGEMDEVRESLFGVASATYQTSMEMGDTGVVAAEKAAEAARGHTDALRDQLSQAGLTGEQIDALFEKYSLFPDDIMTQIHVEGADLAEQVLGSLDTSLANISTDAHTITVDSSAIDMTAEQAKELGFTLEEDLDAGIVEITAETDLARSAIEEIAAQTEELGTRDNTVEFRGDVEDAVADLNELEEKSAKLVQPWEMKILADTEESRAAIEELGIEVEHLPGGNIFVDDNTPGVMDRLRELGAETGALPEGHIRITDTSDENLSRLHNLGISTLELPNGDVFITDNALAVSDHIEGTLDGKRTKGTHEITAHWTGDLNHGVQSTGGMWRGGRLPSYAEGDRHGGYRLPASGPGTEVTDGFLALDRFGMPVARLDAREWVINGQSSELYDRELAAINAGVFPKLPGYKDGAKHGAQAAATPTAVDTASVPEGGSDALSVAEAIGDAVEGIPEERETTITVTAAGVGKELEGINAQLEPLGEGETITVDAVSAPASQVLTALGAEVTALPDGEVEVSALPEPALASLGEVSERLVELGDTEVHAHANLDIEQVNYSADEARSTLEDLAAQTPTPVADLVIESLLAGKATSVAELSDLNAMVPTPAADLNHAQLDSGVQHSESELQRVGDQKATSVVDADNSAAITNINNTIDALNNMPVARTIKIEAIGSAASSIGRLRVGGKVPKHAAGGRLPTTGPGTDTTDGILGIGSDGVPTSWVDAGEWVITKGRSEQFDRTLAAINGGSPSDIAEAIQRDLPATPKFADGGKVGQVSPEMLLDFAAGQNVAGQQAARSLQGAPYVWGGINWGDCSGAMAGLARFATGLSAFGGRFATMNQREALAAMGFQPGLGDPSTSFNLGWFNGGPWGGHTAGDIGGTAVEMGGGAGGQGKIGGAAASASHPQFTDHAHLSLGELVAYDLYRPLPKVAHTRQAAPDPQWQTEGGMGVGSGGLGVGPGGMGVSHTGGDGIHMTDGSVVKWDDLPQRANGGRLPKDGPGSGQTDSILGIGSDGVPTARVNHGEWVVNPRSSEVYDSELGMINEGTFPKLAGGGRAGVGSNPGARVVTFDLGDEARDVVDAMREVADGLHEISPELSYMAHNMADDVSAAISQAELVIDPTTVEGITARGASSRLLDLDILPGSSSIKGLLDAEQELLDARAAQEARAQDITDAEVRLAEARKELADAQSASTEMSVQDRRKLDDAERALSEARAAQAEADGDKQAAAAEKVADAEEKLRRAREDVSTGLVEDEEKRQEQIVKATEAVTAAEHDLIDVRQAAVEALDTPIGQVLPQLSQGLTAASGAMGGLATQVGALGGLGAQAAPLLGGAAGQLAGLAAAAGPAGVSVGMVLTAVEVTVGVLRDLYNVFDELNSAAIKAKISVAEGYASSMSSIRQWTQMVDEQRQAVARARQAMVQAQINVVEAQWQVRQASIDVGRAQLEGVKTVAQAEAALAEERERQAKIDAYHFNDLSTEYDRYRWKQKETIDGALDDYNRVTPEILALQEEVRVAQLRAASNTLSAQLAQLEASKGLHDAQVALARGQRDLTRALEDYNRMANNAYGLSTPQAMVGEEVARLQAQNAQLAGERDSLSTVVSDGFWNLIDWNKDGKAFFGLIDAPSGQRDALDAQIAENNALIDRLLESEYAPEWTPEQRREIEGAIDRAGVQYAHGNEAAAQAIIDSSILGDADRYTRENELWQSISDWEAGEQALVDGMEDLESEISYLGERMDLEGMIQSYDAEAESRQYLADAYRESNPAIREALVALAEYEGKTARELANRPPSQTLTLVGDNFNADQVYSAINQLNQGTNRLDLRVQRLEGSGAAGASDVLNSRR